MKKALIKINNFINSDLPSSILITSILCMVFYQLHDGRHGSAFFMMGYVAGFVCLLFLKEKASRVLTWLSGISLIIGLLGFYILDEFPNGTIPLELKWICGFTGQLSGILSVSMVLQNTSYKKSDQ